MANYLINISETNNEAKYLIGLIKEIAKTNKSIFFKKLLNKETLKSFDDVEKGKVFSAKNTNDLFNQLEQ